VKNVLRWCSDFVRIFNCYFSALIKLVRRQEGIRSATSVRLIVAIMLRLMLMPFLLPNQQMIQSSEETENDKNAVCVCVHNMTKRWRL